MPTNDKNYQREYQRQYREKMAKTRKVVSISLPLDDHDELSRFARAQNMSLSKLLREASLNQARNAQMHTAETNEQIRELHFLISNIANNVNQMAYHSHRLKQVVDENEVLKELQKLDASVHEFITSRQSP